MRRRPFRPSPMSMHVIALFLASPARFGLPMRGSPPGRVSSAHAALLRSPARRRRKLIGFLRRERRFDVVSYIVRHNRATMCGSWSGARCLQPRLQCVVQPWLQCVSSLLQTAAEHIIRIISNCVSVHVVLMFNTLSELELWFWWCGSCELDGGHSSLGFIMLHQDWK